MEGLGIEHLDAVSTVGHARAHIMRHSVDLILLDNGLPDGFGVDFAMELRNTPRFAKIPVVIISDWPTPFMYDKASAARVGMVLGKDDFQPRHVRDALRFARVMAMSKQ